LAGIGAGIATFAWPQITAFVLLYLIAGWVIATGFAEIAAAITLRRLIGAYAIVFGVLLVGLGIRPQRWHAGGTHVPATA
jgi:uncharacterized membrane protein HdeD (DUF308 family)